MRTKLLLGGLIAIAAGLAAPALAQSPGCIDVNLLADPSTVCEGQTATLHASIINCGETRDRVRVTLLIRGPGFDREFAAIFRVARGANKEMALPITVPAGMPAGTWTVSVNAFSRKGGSDSATATLEAVSCQ